MMLSVGRYGIMARILHWVVAAAVIVQLGLGWASEWTEEREASFRLIRTHYQLGMTILALMLLRLLWRMAQGAPRPIGGEPRWRRQAAKATHWALYALLLTMPISGYVIWVWMEAPTDVWGLVTVPRLFTPPVDDETWRANAWYIHYYSSWALVALITLHVSAAAWHEFVKRDGLIRRMI